MAVYTIIRVYEVPADNRIEATDRMLEVLELHVEKDYHVKDVIREPGAKEGRVVKLTPSDSWMTLFLRQLFGKQVAGLPTLQHQRGGEWEQGSDP